MRYAIITGASSGIGKEIAIEFAKRGYSPILVARRKARLEEFAEQLSEKFPVRPIVYACDLSSREACETLFKEVQSWQPEILVNNAGFGDCGKFVETDLEKEIQMISLNIQALHILTKRFICYAASKSQKEKSKFYVLNVASSAGLLPGGPYMATYYASKAYVASLSQALAKEVQDSNALKHIQISCLCPGPVDTEFNDVANVEFALPGITVSDCARYAVKQMFRGHCLIVPSFFLRVLLYLAKLLPNFLSIKITARQQKKKFQAINK